MYVHVSFTKSPSRRGLAVPLAAFCVVDLRPPDVLSSPHPLSLSLLPAMKRGRGMNGSKENVPCKPTCCLFWFVSVHFAFHFINIKSPFFTCVRRHSGPTRATCVAFYTHALPPPLPLPPSPPPLPPPRLPPLPLSPPLANIGIGSEEASAAPAAGEGSKDK